MPFSDINNPGSSGSPTSGGTRTVTFVVAASNSTNKSQADYICTGTNDDVTINAALAALPSFGQAGARAGKVLLRAGTYNIGASIVIDGDYTTLEGENFPMWGGYNHAWTGTGSPSGSIGVGPAKIQASATGFDLISFQNNNIPAGTGSNASDQNRHRGMCVRNLYLVGNGYTAQGISTTYGATPLAGGSDVSLIENCMIQRCTNGINVGQDSWTFKNNNIQDNSGAGIVVSGTNGFIIDNLIYDIGGIGIQSFVGNLLVQGNRIGDVSLGIYVQSNSSVIANQISSTNTNGIEIDGNNTSVIGNSVSTNSSGGGSPIDINVGRSFNTITGNTVTPTTSSGAVAIYLGFGPSNSVSGNNISGTFSGGYIGAFNAAALASNYVWHNEPYATLNGTTAGTVISSVTLNGNTKTFTAVFSGYENNSAVNQTISFTIPFANTPVIVGNTLSGLTVTVTSATVFTITAPNSTSTFSGVVIVQGQ